MEKQRKIFLLLLVLSIMSHVSGFAQATDCATENAKAYDYRIGQDDPIEGGMKLFLVVSINRNEYEKTRLTATMRSIRSRFPKCAKLAILLMDNHARGRSISSKHTHNPSYEKDLAFVRGYYSFDRETGKEFLEFSFRRGEPEVKFDLSKK